MLHETLIGNNLAEFWREVCARSMAVTPQTYAGETDLTPDDTDEILFFSSDKGNQHKAPYLFALAFRSQMPSEIAEILLNRSQDSIEYIDAFVKLDMKTFTFNGKEYKLVTIENGDSEGEIGLDLWLTPIEHYQHLEKENKW